MWISTWISSDSISHGRSDLCPLLPVMKGSHVEAPM
jgi:hypothetical protein